MRSHGSAKTNIYRVRQCAGAFRKDAGDGFCTNGRHGGRLARFADEHRAQFEVMFAAELHPGGAAEAGAIRQAQQTGEVRQGDPALLARVVWALVLLEGLQCPT
jgi:hypothetical protein